MLNPNIFFGDQPPTTTPPTPQSAPEGLSIPESVRTAPLDCDGNPVMPPWSSNEDTLRRYNLQTSAWRSRRSREWVAAETEKMNAPDRRASGGSGKKFTTQYACDWARRQKRKSGLSWTVVDRENWVAPRDPKKAARSVDLILGMDVMCDDGEPGLVGLQAGTPGQELAHARTFLDRGGPAKAKQFGIRCHWIAFIRNQHEPLEFALWTDEYLRARFPDLFAPAKPLQL